MLQKKYELPIATYLFSLYVDLTLSLSLVLWAFVYDFAFVDLQAGMRNSDKCS